MKYDLKNSIEAANAISCLQKPKGEWIIGEVSGVDVRKVLEEMSIEDTGLSKTVTVEKELQMYIEQYRKTGRI